MLPKYYRAYQKDRLRICHIKKYNRDVITKEYMEDTEVFADVFNHMIYKGEKVIDPKNLKMCIRDRWGCAGKKDFHAELSYT